MVGAECDHIRDGIEQYAVGCDGIGVWGVTYSPDMGTVLSAGTGETLSVTLTPSDTVDYTNATTTVQINVNQAAPTITWTAPSAITYGTALSSAQLDATSTVAGSLAYSPDTGAVLSAGTGQTLSVTLVPTDTVDYTNATTTVAIDVKKSTPTITWTPPEAIIYGTALGSSQLNATASASGPLVYSPAAGTVLGIGGSQALQVSFTPADTTDYTTATARVYIDVNPTTLSVTDFTQMTTGFQSVFNGVLNTSVLDLADVSLTGNATGPISGSLVVDQVGGISRITFLVSGGTGVGLSPLVHGILPNDTYTMTFISAGTGFVDTSGGLLNDGSNYSTTFTVANPTAALVVSLPDFARGPGQTVNVPATSSSNGIPLQVDNTGASVMSVTSIKMNLVYNPALLTITGGSVAAGMPTSARVTVNTTDLPGTAQIDFESTTALLINPEVAATCIRLTATVPHDAPYGSKEILDLQDLKINNNATGVVADDAMHVVAYTGDTTMAGSYSVEDAMNVARVAVQLNTGFAAWPLLDPVVLADVYSDGLINAVDAMSIARYVLGLPTPQIPAMPEGVTPAMSGPDPQLSVVGCQLSVPDSTVQVPVMLDQSDGLTGVNLVIAYDTSRLKVSAADVEKGSLTTGFDSFTVRVDQQAGIIYISGYGTDGPLMGQGAGSVANISFQVKDNAPAGAAFINLMASSGTARTALSGVDALGNPFLFDLEPRPSNAAGDALDGRIDVLSLDPLTQDTLGH